MDIDSKRKILFERARKIVKKSLAQKDKHIINAINSLDDLNKEINQFSERLKDWYGLKFPELEDIVPTPVKYAQTVIAIERNFSDDKFVEITSKEKMLEIMKAKKETYGADIDENDMAMILKIADLIVSLSELKSDLEEYVEMKCSDVCKNITYLCGALLTARLLKVAGGLKELAEMPASTIQVLGAEKALFKHIRKGTAPPKHGILFQHPLISGAPRNKRGKIARTLAAKIAIAAKADAFTGNFIADKLKQDLDKRLEGLK